MVMGIRNYCYQCGNELIGSERSEDAEGLCDECFYEEEFWIEKDLGIPFEKIRPKRKFDDER